MVGSWEETLVHGELSRNPRKRASNFKLVTPTVILGMIHAVSNRPNLLI